jgi:hypothetical protein
MENKEALMKENTTLNNTDFPMVELGERNIIGRIKYEAIAMQKYIYLGLLFIAPLIWFVYTFDIRQSWNDPDTFWHIRVGQQILTEGIIPTVAINTFQDNLQYIPHEAGFQMLIGFLFNLAGWNGLNAFSLVSLFLLSLGLYRSAEAASGKVWHKLHPFIHLMIIVSLKFVFDSYFTNRPQVISTICILWFFIWLHRLHASQQPKNLIPMALLALVVSNFHSGVYPIVLAIWFIYVADQVLSKKTYSGGHYIKIFLFSIFLVACMVINLGGFAAASYITTATKNNFQSFIREWAPLNFYARRNFALLLLVYIWSMAFNPNKNLFRVLTSTGILVLGIWCHKTFVFLPVFLVYEFTGAIRGVKFLNYNINKGVYLVLFVAFGISVVLKTAFTPYALPATTYPVDELQYIQENTKTNDVKPKVLADYGVSGFLNFNNVRVLADGRFDPFIVEKTKDSNEKTAFERSFMFSQRADISVIQQDDPDYVIIQKKSEPAGSTKGEDATKKALEQLGKPDFEGQYGMVWARKAGGWDYVSNKQ